MDNFFFWKNWNTEYKALFYVSLTLLVGSNVFLGIVHYSGVDFLQDWGSIQELATIPVDFHKFTDHYHEFQVKIVNYMVYERYTSTNLTFPKHLVTVYMAILFLATVLYNTFLTTFSKYFYYAGIFLMMVFLATLNLDLLDVFDPSSKTVLTIFIIVICGSSYAIYSYFYNLNLLQRFGIFFVLHALLIGGVYALSPLPANDIDFHIAGYSSASLIVLCGGYLLYVGIENTLFLLFLNSSNSRGGMIPYIAINLLYIGALVLMIYFRIEVTGLGIFTLIMIASLVTIWGTLKRNEDNTKGDTVARVMMIAVLGSIVISTLAFHMGHQNSSFISATRKIATSGFLGYGAMFFLFTMVNHIDKIYYKMPVYPGVFRATKLSVYHMYIMGTIAFFGIITQKYDKRVFYEGISGYYNAIADFYYNRGEFEIAEPFYQEAKGNSAFNTKSNIALASLSIKKGDLDAAIEHFNYTTASGSSEMAFLQLANIYHLRDNYFDALFTLKEGVKYYPKSSRLWNNLGMLSKKSSMADSTLFYFQKAYENAEENDLTAINNMITYLLKNGYEKEVKDLISEIAESQYDIKTKAVLAAYNAKMGVFNTWKKQPIKVDSVLNTDELAYLYNHFINNLELMDSSDLDALEQTSQSPSNVFNQEQLTTLKAFYQFYRNDPRVAREHMATLAASTSFYAGYYNNLLGYWMMMHDNYELANRYMSVADAYGFEQGRFNHAFIETIKGSSAADSLWASLNISDSADIRYQLMTKNPEVKNLSDFEKLLYISLGHYDQYTEAIVSCKDEQTRSLIHFEYFNHLLDEGKTEEANALLTQQKEAFEQHIPEDAFSISTAQLLTMQGKAQEAISIMENITAPMELRGRAMLVNAKALELAGKTAQAKEAYLQLVEQHPFQEQGLLSASEFMRAHDMGDLAYNITVEGVKTLQGSVALRKEYVWLCLDQVLLDYAAETVNELSRLMPPEEFRTFNAKYKERLAEIEKRFEAWE